MAILKPGASDPANRALRDDALSIFAAGVEAADPGRTVRRALRLGLGGGLVVCRDEILFPGKLHVLALGKAAVTMARAAADSLPPAAFGGPGLIIVNDENAAEVERFRVIPTGHPVPDARGAAAAREVEAYLAGASREDGLLVLISGGGSALLPAPAGGITLEEKAAVTSLLLGSGADIGEINTVRKHLSRLKGGGLAQCAYPAAVEALILSDVIGNDLGTIASGPTAPDATTFRDALAVLGRRRILDAVPASVRRRLEEGAAGGEPETPKPGDPVFGRVRNRILGSNEQSLEAAARRATELAYAVEQFPAPLCGEAREAGRLLAARLEALQPGGRPVALLAGGETTVTLRGRGRGGRNQELALAFAIEAARCRRRFVLLSGGTDGRDGPTDAAGGVVDGSTLARMKSRGVDARERLEDNDSHTALEAAGDLLVTGPTGTNVADLQVLLVSGDR